MSKHAAARAAIADDHNARRQEAEAGTRSDDLDDYGGQQDIRNIDPKERERLQQAADESESIEAAEADNDPPVDPPAQAQADADADPPGPAVEEREDEPDPGTLVNKSRMEIMEGLARQNAEHEGRIPADESTDADADDEESGGEAGATAGEDDDDLDIAAKADDDGVVTEGLEDDDPVVAAAREAGLDVRLDNGVQKAVLTVEGQEKLVPVTEIFRNAQKFLAADRRLEQATEASGNLVKWNQNLQEREAALADKLKAVGDQVEQATDDPSLSDEDVADRKKSLKTFVDAVYGDDAEAAIEALDAAMGDGRGDATLTPERIKEIVAESINEQRGIEEQRDAEAKAQQEADDQRVNDWQGAKETFIEEFPEIKQGSQLWQTTNAKIREIMSATDYDPSTPYVETFREAGNAVRALVKEVSGDTIQSRKDKKLNAQQHVSAKSSATQPAKPAPKANEPASQHQLIQEMHRRRRPTQAY